MGKPINLRDENYDLSIHKDLNIWFILQQTEYWYRKDSQCLLEWLTVWVQLIGHVQLFATPWTAASQTSLSIINSKSLLKLMSIESVVPSNHLILCCPLLPLSSIFPSIRVFSSESAICIRWPKYWSFSISSSNEYSELISFRINWFDLLAVHATLKSIR